MKYRLENGTILQKTMCETCQSIEWKFRQTDYTRCVTAWWWSRQRQIEILFKTFNRIDWWHNYNWIVTGTVQFLRNLPQWQNILFSDAAVLSELFLVLYVISCSFAISNENLG